MQANVGRRGQGVKELTEIEIDRHSALVEDVSSDKRFVALEDSSLDGDSIRTSDKETDGTKSDEEIDEDSDTGTDKECEEELTHPARRSRATLTRTSLTQMMSSRWLLRCL